MDDETGESSLLMPFIPVTSKGGPFDDQAFTAGFHCGQIFQALSTAVASNASTVRYPLVNAVLLEQLDLIAMHHGYVISSRDTRPEFPEWVDVTFMHAELGTHADTER